MLNQSQIVIRSSALASSLLRRLPAEWAHESAMMMMQVMPELVGACFGIKRAEVPLSLATTVPGIGALSHPIGLAAGFDKNALVLPALESLGFSFLEVGAVTPNAQPGNPKPRLFRIPDEHALINRMGFNNDGLEAIKSRLNEKQNRKLEVPVMINMGKNRVTSQDRALEDYEKVFYGLATSAGCFVANISSPNTPGLRQLANSEFLHSMAACFAGDIRKIWLKLDPDMAKEKFQAIVALAVELGFGGFVLTNTAMVTQPQSGGLSGRPIFSKSNEMLKWAWEVHRGQMPMIGVGGIWSGADVVEKIRFGANAVQIYTAFVYQGPAVVRKMINELEAELNRLGVRTISDIRGTHDSLTKS